MPSPVLQELCLYEDWSTAAQQEADQPPSSLGLAHGCLPASLRRLELAAQSFGELPAAIPAAAQLTRLALGNGGRQIGLQVCLWRGGSAVQRWARRAASATGEQPRFPPACPCPVVWAPDRTPCR